MIIFQVLNHTWLRKVGYILNGRSDLYEIYERSVNACDKTFVRVFVHGSLRKKFGGHLLSYELKF